MRLKYLCYWLCLLVLTPVYICGAEEALQVRLDEGATVTLLENVPSGTEVYVVSQPRDGVVIAGDTWLHRQKKVTLPGEGSLVYRHAGVHAPQDTLRVRVGERRLLYTMQVVTVNDPPVCHAVTWVIPNDSAIVVDFLSAEDEEGDPFVFKIATPPQRGAVEIKNMKTGESVYRVHEAYRDVTAFRDSFVVIAGRGRQWSKPVRIVITKAAPVAKMPPLPKVSVPQLDELRAEVRGTWETDRTVTH